MKYVHVTNVPRKYAAIIERELNRRMLVDEPLQRELRKLHRKDVKRLLGLK